LQNLYLEMELNVGGSMDAQVNLDKCRDNNVTKQWVEAEASRTHFHAITKGTKHLR